MSAIGTAVALAFWLTLAWVIYREWRADAQVRADTASMRRREAAREALR